MAILWTLFIFVGCLYPGNELPKVGVPFFDKWTHFVLFGVFSFLWAWAWVPASINKLIRVCLSGIVLGVVIEGLQGILASLGRSAETMDAIADAVGTVLGAVVFYLIARRAN